MFADVLKLPVQTVLANETGALGCAIAVAAAVGDYADLSAAARGMCKVAQCVQPDPKKPGSTRKSMHFTAKRSNAWIRSGSRCSS